MRILAIDRYAEPRWRAFSSETPGNEIPDSVIMPNCAADLNPTRCLGQFKSRPKRYRQSLTGGVWGTNAAVQAVTSRLRATI